MKYWTPTDIVVTVVWLLVALGLILAAHGEDRADDTIPAPRNIDLSGVSEVQIAQTVLHLKVIVDAATLRADSLEHSLNTTASALSTAKAERVAAQKTIDTQAAEITALKPWRAKCIRGLLIVSAFAAWEVFRKLAFLTFGPPNPYAVAARWAAALGAGVAAYFTLLHWL